METNPPTLNRNTVIIAVIVSALVVTGLYNMFPYNMGYGLEPVTVFRNLRLMWFGAEMGEWRHCAFVPLVTLFFVWLDRQKLATTPVRSGSADGLAALVFAGVVYWLGYKIDFTILGFLSLQITLGALLLWFFGRQFMRAIFFPWAFLVFAWPMPFINTNQLSLIIAKISAHLLNFAGMDCLQEGVKIISAPKFAYGLRIAQGQLFSLEVAAACSGLRSLFALMMVAALGGYLLLDKPWQRWVLFFCSIPLAMTGNVCRVVLLAFGAQMFGSEFAIGTEEHPSMYHLFAGYMIFVIALGGMFIIGWLLTGGWRAVARVCGFKLA
ncbi:MAG: exosortase/archaeosortase family protein [Verrucomicrobiales bacterium]|jgi:exosortase|nr:exosortase/archaeosortase family protein [Verrucomicrobiales bacterium]